MMGSFSWRQVRSISLACEAFNSMVEPEDVDAVKANPGDVFQTGVHDPFTSAVDNA